MNDETNALTRVHHPLSPSQLQSLEVCPCYQNRNTESLAALKGTLQHGVTESRQDDNRLSDEEMVAAAECIDFIEHHKRLMEEERTRDYNAMAHDAGVPVDEFPLRIPGVLEITEEYLPIDDERFENVPQFDPKTGNTTVIGFDHTTAGFIDKGLLSWDRKRALLFDWKFGQWAVEDAKNNLQGIAYTLGLFRKYPSLEAVTFFFKQPAINALSSATWGRERVNELYLRVRTVVERAIAARRKGDFTAARPTTPGCLFCAHVGRCPAVAALACKVGAKFYPLEIPANITPTLVQDHANTVLGLRLASVVGVWADAFKRQVSDRVIRRDAPIPPGYSIESRADREIVDTKIFRQVALRHVPEAAYTEMCPPPTFGDLEGKVNEMAPRGSKKASIQLLRDELETAGAVKKGLPYSFLKAIPLGKKDQE